MTSNKFSLIFNATDHRPRIIRSEILDQLFETLQLYRTTYEGIIDDKYKVFAKENELRAGIKQHGYIMEYDTLDLDNKLINMFYDRLEGLKKCKNERELSYYSTEYENLNSFLNSNKMKQFKIMETEIDNKLSSLDDRTKFYLKNNHLDKIDNVINDELKTRIEKFNELKNEIAKDGCHTIKWGIIDKECKGDFIKSLIKNNTLHWNTITDKEYTDGIQLDDNERQPVFGPNESPYAQYKNCSTIFDGDNKIEVLKSGMIGLLEPCDNLVEFTSLLNRFSSLCKYYTKSPFIRFFLPDGLVMPHRRYIKDDNRGEKIGEFHIGDFKLNIHETIDGKPDYDKFTRKGYYFKLYNNNDMPINIPLLRSNVTVTYTEFRDFKCYLNLPFFRSKYDNNMLFIPNHHTKMQLKEMDENTKKIYLKKMEILEINYDCVEIEFENGNKKKYIFLVDNCDNNNYLRSDKLELNNKCYYYNDNIQEHAKNKIINKLQTGGNTNELFNYDIASNYYKLYMEKYKEYNLLFDFNDEIDFATFSFYFNKYGLIIPKDWIDRINTTITKIQNKLIKTETYNKIENINESIIIYKPFSTKFFYEYEIIYNNNFILKNCKNILELTNYPNSLEGCYYYEKKYKNTLSNYKLLFFSKYSTIKDHEDYLKYYTQYIQNINTEIISTCFTEDMYNKKNNSYDVIFSKLYYVEKNIYNLFNVTLNYKLFIYQLYYSVLNLNNKGHLIFFVSRITDKRTADLVIFVSKFFKHYYLYTPEVQNNLKFSHLYVIFKKRKSNKKIKKKLEKFKKIFLKYFTKDKNGLQITFPSEVKNYAYNKISNFEDKFISNDPLPKNILNYPTTHKIYNKIKVHNSNIYFDKYRYMLKLIKYKKYNETDLKKQIKIYNNGQLIHAKNYAKKYDFKIISINKDMTDISIGNIIKSDIYSIYEPISFSFKYYNEYENLIDIPEIFKQYDRDLFMTDYLIDTRNINEWNKMKRRIRFYRNGDKMSELRQLIEKNFNQQNVSQAWLKMYEILEKFKIIKKDIKSYSSFNLCEAPGNFISAINHYVKTKTTTKKYIWYAQTLNPEYEHLGGLTDQYGYIKKYKDNWIFGEDNTGNIMSVNNIKFYRKYTLDINVDLMTSDCGIPECLGFDEITKLHIIQLIFILYNLPNNSSFVAKMKFPIIYPIQIELYFILYNNFEKLSFFKGNLNPSSKEFYVIGQNYKRLGDDELNKLLNIVNNYDKKKIYRKYPDSFLSQLQKIYSILVDNYIFSIERKLFYVDNYKKISDKHFDNMDRIMNEKSNDWIKINKIKPIDKLDLL